MQRQKGSARRGTSQNPQYQSILTRLQARKNLRLSIGALMNETSTNSQFVQDYGTGRTYVVKDTAQKAYREYLRRKESPVKPTGIREGSFHSAWEQQQKGKFLGLTKDEFTEVLRRDNLRSSHQVEIRLNGDYPIEPYSVRQSASRRKQSPYEELQESVRKSAGSPRSPRQGSLGQDSTQQKQPKTFLYQSPQFRVREPSTRLKVQLKPQICHSKRKSTQIKPQRKALMLGVDEQSTLSTGSLDGGAVGSNTGLPAALQFNSAEVQRRVKRQITSQQRLLNLNLKKLRLSPRRNFDSLRSSYDVRASLDASDLSQTNEQQFFGVEKVSPDKLKKIDQKSVHLTAEPAGVPMSMLDSTGVTSFDQQKTSMIGVKAIENSSSRPAHRNRAGSLRELTTHVSQFSSRESQRQMPIPAHSNQSQLDVRSFNTKNETVNMLSLRIAEHSSFANSMYSRQSQRHSPSSSSKMGNNSLASLQAVRKPQLGSSAMVRRQRFNKVGSSIENSLSLKQDALTSARIGGKLNLLASSGRTVETRNAVDISNSGLRHQTSAEKLSFKMLRGLQQKRKEAVQRKSSPRFLKSEEDDDQEDQQVDFSESLHVDFVRLAGGHEDSSQSLLPSMGSVSRILSSSLGLPRRFKQK